MSSKLVQFRNKAFKKTSSAEISRRTNQSKRDKVKFQDSSIIKHSETFAVVKTGDKAKEPTVVYMNSINELDGIQDFMVAKAATMENSDKRVIVDVKKFQIECVNASTKGPAIALCKLGSETKRTILPMGAKVNVSFAPMSSLNGDSEVTCTVPQFGGDKAEVWFIIKCSVGLRYIY